MIHNYDVNAFLEFSGIILLFEFLFMGILFYATLFIELLNKKFQINHHVNYQ